MSGRTTIPVGIGPVASAGSGPVACAISALPQPREIATPRVSPSLTNQASSTSPRAAAGRHSPAMGRRVEVGRRTPVFPVLTLGRGYCARPLVGVTRTRRAADGPPGPPTDCPHGRSLSETVWFGDAELGAPVVGPARERPGAGAPRQASRAGGDVGAREEAMPWGLRNVGEIESVASQRCRHPPLTAASGESNPPARPGTRYIRGARAVAAKRSRVRHARGVDELPTAKVRNPARSPPRGEGTRQSAGFQGRREGLGIRARPSGPRRFAESAPHPRVAASTPSIGAGGGGSTGAGGQQGKNQARRTLHGATRASPLRAGGRRFRYSTSVRGIVGLIGSRKR